MEGSAAWLAVASVLVAALVLAAPARAETAPLIESVTVTGDAVAGETLSALAVATGDPEPSLSYAWLRCSPLKPSQCDRIDGADSVDYLVSSAYVGLRLRVAVTATNVAGSDSMRSEPIAEVAPAPEATPDPTVEPTPDPTVEPTPDPTVEPTPDPTVEPTPDPTVEPTPDPTVEPTPTGGDSGGLLPPLVGGLPTPTIGVLAAQEPGYLQPFPVVRIRGRILPRAADITLLRVTAGSAARVQVDCTGRRCPVQRVVRGPGRLRAFERVLPFWTVLTIRVTGANRIGKYVRIRIRAGKAPARRDACLLPGTSWPSECTRP